MDDWYAVQVRTGRERTVVLLSQKIADRAVLKECFIPYCDRMKRYQGKWHVEQHILFPGYVFMVTGQVEKLFWELKKLSGFAKILGNGVDFIPIRQEEKSLLLHIGGEGHQSGMSQGVIEGDMVIITSGPLTKLSGEITYIDRHKRLAMVRVEMFGRFMDVKLGLEIVHKE